MPVILANSDKSCEANMIATTGGIATGRKYARGKFIHFVPDSQMFMYAHEGLVQEIGPLEKSEILMVGDTLETDILVETNLVSGPCWSYLEIPELNI